MKTHKFWILLMVLTANATSLSARAEGLTLQFGCTEVGVGIFGIHFNSRGKSPETFEMIKLTSVAGPELFKKELLHTWVATNVTLGPSGLMIEGQEESSGGGDSCTVSLILTGKDKDRKEGNARAEIVLPNGEEQLIKLNCFVDRY